MWKKLNPLTSPKTSAIAIILFLKVLITTLADQVDGDLSTIPDWNQVVELLMAAGLWFARDNNISDEQAGAK